ncbi:MAG: hypothetical protein AMXMBFR61_01900 [Fimbriimonadales bacterium]
MASSGKTVDPILIGIIALGVVGVGVIYFLSTNQEITPLPEPDRPNLTKPQSALMSGNASMWGSGEQQDMMGAGGGMPMGPSMGPTVGPPGPGPAGPGGAPAATGGVSL